MPLLALFLRGLDAQHQVFVWLRSNPLPAVGLGAAALSEPQLRVDGVPSGLGLCLASPHPLPSSQFCPVPPGGDADPWVLGLPCSLGCTGVPESSCAVGLSSRFPSVSRAGPAPGRSTLLSVSPGFAGSACSPASKCRPRSARSAACPSTPRRWRRLPAWRNSFRPTKLPAEAAARR